MTRYRTSGSGGLGNLMVVPLVGLIVAGSLIYAGKAWLLVPIGLILFFVSRMKT